MAEADGHSEDAREWKLERRRVEWHWSGGMVWHWAVLDRRSLLYSGTS
jgi:hypothetical protein